MTRQELIQLRDAIDMALALPDSLRELLAQWLTPEAAKPNGHDRNAPVLMSTPRMVKVQAKRTRKPTPAQAAERKLLAAMRDNPASASSPWPTLRVRAERRLGSVCDRWRRAAWSRRISRAVGS